MDILEKIIVVLGCILTFIFVIKFLDGDFDKKSLKIGRRVAVIVRNIETNRDEFKIGKIVAMREKADGTYWDLLYAVRFEDGKIGLFNARQLYTEWGRNENNPKV